VEVSLKSYVRDQVRRNAERLSRPIRIARGFGEYADRRRLAHEVESGRTYDVSALRRDGYLAIKPPGDLIEGLVTGARQKLEQAASLPQSRGKAFFSQLLGPEDLRLDGVFLRFALQEDLLSTIAQYLGIAPFLESVELLYSKPAQGPPAQSQQWHKDRTDRRIIKVFVYATEVRPENGPLSLLGRSDSEKVPGFLFHYVSDNSMAKYVDLSRTVVLTGPPGTTLLIDSQTCYHLGSRCQEPRLAYVAYYSSGFGYRGRETKRTLDPGEITSLSSLQRYALGVSP
jgi:hypothetical protein